MCLYQYWCRHYFYIGEDMKKITLNDIKSGNVLGNIEKVSIMVKVNDEECEFDTHIKPFSYSTAIAQLKAYTEDKEALAGVIASCLCDENGVLLFTEEDVRDKFSQALVDATWGKIYEVNSLGKSKKSTTKTKSSVKSPLPQDEQLQK